MLPFFRLYLLLYDILPAIVLAWQMRLEFVMADATLATADLDTAPGTNRFRSPDMIAKLLLAAVVALLLGLGLFALKAIERLPPAPIQIQSQGLNSQEYTELTQLLGKQAPGNFLQADLQTYVDKLAAVSWVEQVDIRRDWQQGLIVKVVPRQAVAKFGSERLVDANGVVYTPADSQELQAHPWMQLQGDTENAVIMMQQVKQVSDWFLPLGLKVEEVIVSPRMAWLFRFDNGLRVMVDNENTSEKLYKLSVMLQNQLKSQLPKIQTIDLRYKNGMAITWRPVIADTNVKNTTVKKAAPTKSATPVNVSDNGSNTER